MTELIDHLLATDLADLEPRLTRHEIPLGQREGGETVRLKPYGVSVLLAGTSGGGKSTFATGFLERLGTGIPILHHRSGGDYQNFEGAVVSATLSGRRRWRKRFSFSKSRAKMR